MKRLISFIASFVIASTFLFAHEGNEHVRGVVTQVSPQSITVQTPDKKTRTLSLTPKTTFQQAGKVAHLADLKIGDRVVVDVPEKTTDAVLIQIGTAAAPTPAKAAPAKKLEIAFVAQPARTGDNRFEVLVKDAVGQPITDGDVSVVLTMPAMPALKMPAMRSAVTLTHAGGGKYAGNGQLPSVGMWTATVSVKENGAEVGQKKVTVTVR